MIVYGSAGRAETHRRLVEVKGEADYRSEWLESSQHPGCLRSRKRAAALRLSLYCYIFN